MRVALFSHSLPGVKVEGVLEPGYFLGMHVMHDDGQPLCGMRAGFVSDHPMTGGFCVACRACINHLLDEKKEETP